MLTIIGQLTNSFKQGSTCIMLCPYLHCTLSSPHLLFTILWKVEDFGAPVFKKFPLIIMVCFGTSDDSFSLGCQFFKILANMLSDTMLLSAFVAHA